MIDATVTGLAVIILCCMVIFIFSGIAVIHDLIVWIMKRIKNRKINRKPYKGIPIPSTFDKLYNASWKNRKKDLADSIFTQNPVDKMFMGIDRSNPDSISTATNSWWRGKLSAGKMKATEMQLEMNKQFKECANKDRLDALSVSLRSSMVKSLEERLFDNHSIGTRTISTVEDDLIAKKMAGDAYDKTFGKEEMLAVNNVIKEYTARGAPGLTIIDPTEFYVDYGLNGVNTGEKEDELCICSKNLWK